MNSFEIGAGITFALFIIGWLTATELRLRGLKSSLDVAKQEKDDAQISEKTRSLSDAELDALVKSELSGGSQAQPKQQ